MQRNKPIIEDILQNIGQGQNPVVKLTIICDKHGLLVHNKMSYQEKASKSKAKNSSMVSCPCYSCLFCPRKSRHSRDAYIYNENSVDFDSESGEFEYVVENLMIKRIPTSLLKPHAKKQTKETIYKIPEVRRSKAKIINEAQYETKQDSSPGYFTIPTLIERMPLTIATEPPKQRVQEGTTAIAKEHVRQETLAAANRSPVGGKGDIAYESLPKKSTSQLQSFSTDISVRSTSTQQGTSAEIHAVDDQNTGLSAGDQLATYIPPDLQLIIDALKIAQPPKHGPGILARNHRCVPRTASVLSDKEIDCNLESFINQEKQKITTYSAAVVEPPLKIEPKKISRPLEVKTEELVRTIKQTVPQLKSPNKQTTAESSTSSSEMYKNTSSTVSSPSQIRSQFLYKTDLANDSGSLACPCKLIGPDIIPETTSEDSKEIKEKDNKEIESFPKKPQQSLKWKIIIKHHSKEKDNRSDGEVDEQDNKITHLHKSKRKLQNKSNSS